jgi:hypothetical protein
MTPEQSARQAVRRYAQRQRRRDARLSLYIGRALVATADLADHLLDRIEALEAAVGVEPP